MQLPHATHLSGLIFIEAFLCVETWASVAHLKTYHSIKETLHRGEPDWLRQTGKAIAKTEGKPQISPLRFPPQQASLAGDPGFALSKIILGGLLCQRLWCPTLATQGWGTLDLLEVWIQNRRQSRVPHIWRALCARCGKPQISPLRFAPVEMTKLGVITDQTFLNPIFILLGGPRAHERSGRDDKGRWSGSIYTLQSHAPGCPILA